MRTHCHSQTVDNTEMFAYTCNILEDTTQKNVSDLFRNILRGQKCVLVSPAIRADIVWLNRRITVNIYCGWFRLFLATVISDSQHTARVPHGYIITFCDFGCALLAGKWHNYLEDTEDCKTKRECSVQIYKNGSQKKALKVSFKIGSFNQKFCQKGKSFFRKKKMWYTVNIIIYISVCSKICSSMLSFFDSTPVQLLCVVLITDLSSSFLL